MNRRAVVLGVEKRRRDPRRRVLGDANVAYLDRRAGDAGNDDVVELAGRVDAAERTKADFPLALFERTAGDFDVLALDRVTNLVDRQTVGVQLLDVDEIGRASCRERVCLLV